jgi:AraC family transcriptional regulator of adaptative response/methylated-DNA-[protein]-cysteine methyltransferase
MACASNPIAVAISCHRVVRSNAGLVEYRWDSEHKSKLLEEEAQEMSA